MVDRSSDDDAAGVSARPPGSDRSCRGQAHTLEAVVATVLLVGSLTFALQVTAVTPLSASTSSQHIENQQAAAAEGVLAGAIEDGSLERGLLYCDPGSTDRDPDFNSTGADPYYVDAPTINHTGNLTGFGERLETAFGERSIAYNVVLVFETDGSTVRQVMIDQGTPSDNAVSASRTVTLFDDDNLSRPVDNSTLESTGNTLAAGTCYGSDSVADGSLHKVVKVEVIVWRQ